MKIPSPYRTNCKVGWIVHRGLEGKRESGSACSHIIVEFFQINIKWFLTFLVKKQQQRDIKGSGRGNLPSPLAWLFALRAADDKVVSVCAKRKPTSKIRPLAVQVAAQWTVRPNDARNKHTPTNKCSQERSPLVTLHKTHCFWNGVGKKEEEEKKEFH